MAISLTTTPSDRPQSCSVYRLWGTFIPRIYEDLAPFRIFKDKHHDLTLPVDGVQESLGKINLTEDDKRRFSDSVEVAKEGIANVVLNAWDGLIRRITPSSGLPKFADFLMGYASTSAAYAFTVVYWGRFDILPLCLFGDDIITACNFFGIASPNKTALRAFIKRFKLKRPKRAMLQFRCQPQRLFVTAVA